MIIWIASYPKSGNTWVRSLLSAYLYSNDGVFDFELLKRINQFPNKEYFNFFLKEFNDIKKISEHWIAAQERINLFNDGITFLKTHSALCKLEGNAFTNKTNTKAAIYVVRDPRNIVTSVANHYELSQKEALDFITDKKKMLLGLNPSADDLAPVTVLGDWSDHYKSWSNLKFAPRLIIKYEDLMIDTKKTFTSILNFLKDFMDIKIEEEKIIKVVNSCNFKALQDMEKKGGFKESIKSKKDNKKIYFFNLGKRNDWKKLLKPELEKKIKVLLRESMEELNYI